MQLNFSGAQFITDPYPIGLAKPAFDDESYEALVESFPPLSLLPAFGGAGYKKFALNEKMQPYHTFLESSPIWWAFQNSIKSIKFIDFILNLLADKGIPVLPAKQWTSRFEFAAMPADGGKIDPHTDTAYKAVTLIFSMLRPGEWDPAFGGGTDVLRPKDPTARLESYKAPLSEFEIAHTYPYTPNQCVIFVKNDVSWHSVGPMLGVGSPLMRRTITLNIERAVL